jgi:hypothetical protein
MDGFRGAFARLTFETGFVKHAWVVRPADEQDPNEANNNEIVERMVQVPRGIAGKFNKNSDVFRAGLNQDQWLVNDSSWVNYATRGTNATYFGWAPGTTSGRGVREFGNMIAESQAYPSCLTKRAFRSLCKRDPVAADTAMINRVANSFRTVDNYSLRRLFERVAIQRECLGQ